MIILYILGALLGLFVLYVLFLGICALLVDPKKEYVNNSRFYRFLLNNATAGAIKLLRIKIHVTGLEKLPKGRKLLFISNHRSNFDPIVTWHVLKDWQIAFLSKEDNFKIPFFGRIIRKCCFMPIDREDPRKAIVTINRAAQLLKRQEVSIGVYPEGTRSKNKELLPFHNGVLKTAQKANASVAVLTVTGTENIHRLTPFRVSHVYLDILEVLPAEKLQSIRTDMLGIVIRHLMETNIEKRK